MCYSLVGEHTNTEAKAFCVVGSMEELLTVLWWVQRRSGQHNQDAAGPSPFKQERSTAEDVQAQV